MLTCVQQKTARATLHLSLRKRGVNCDANSYNLQVSEQLLLKQQQRLLNALNGVTSRRVAHRDKGLMAWPAEEGAGNASSPMDCIAAVNWPGPSSLTGLEGGSAISRSHGSVPSARKSRTRK